MFFFFHIQKNSIIFKSKSKGASRYTLIHVFNAVPSFPYRLPPITLFKKMRGIIAGLFWVRLYSGLSKFLNRVDHSAVNVQPGFCDSQSIFVLEWRLRQDSGKSLVHSTTETNLSLLKISARRNCTVSHFNCLLIHG